MMSKWILFLDGCIAGLYLGFICSWIDKTPATGWLSLLCGVGVILQLAVVRYLRRD